MSDVDRDFLTRTYDEQYGFSVELPIDTLRRLLPDGLHAVEVRPGVSVLSINTLCISDDRASAGLAFAEVTGAINVVPDLVSVRRLPKSAIYIVNTGASEPAFPDSDSGSDLLPFHRAPLRLDIDRPRRHVICSDTRGLIFDLRDIGPPPDYEVKESFFQVFAASDGIVRHFGMSFEGFSFEHQVSGRCGQLFEHAFWKSPGIVADAAETYMQTFTAAPGGVQRSFDLSDRRDASPQPLRR